MNSSLVRLANWSIAIIRLAFDKLFSTFCMSGIPAMISINQKWCQKGNKIKISDEKFLFFSFDFGFFDKNNFYLFYLKPSADFGCLNVS